MKSSQPSTAFSNPSLIARIKIGPDGVCEVYSNGYAIYDNGNRKTVVWVPDCGNATYYFGALKDKEKEVVDLDGMISAEEAKRKRELCRKYPFLLPYEALIETDDGDFLPKTDTVSPDFDYSYTMLDFVPSGWQNLFLEMCEEIRQKLTGTDEFHRIRFLEIKEKYGGLRLAATGGNSETDAIIDRCERDSQSKIGRASCRERV